MVIERASLVDAIAESFSLAHAELAGKVLARLGAGDGASEADAGRVIAAVLAELPEANALPVVDRMTLIAADVEAHGQNVRISAVDALSHPALREWVRPTIGEQMAVGLRAGRILTALSPAAPVIGGISAYQVGNDLRTMTADLHFPSVNGGASLHFGAALEAAPRRVVREMCGDLLVGLGMSLDLLGDDALPPSSPEPPAAGPQPETLH